MAGLRLPPSLTGVLGDAKVNIETLQARGTTTGSSVSSITPSGNDDAGSGPGISSPTAPYLYKRVIKAFIYGSRVTGNTPRMELYFGENPKVAQGAYVEIQGINGTSANTWEEMSPAKYAVYDTDTPPWTDGAREDQDWRDTPTTGNNGQTVTHTIWFNPDIEVPITYSSTSGRELITTRRIDSVSATGYTVTVNFNSTHVFRVGDVISVDLVDDLYGRDGLFKVSAVVDTDTIQYELESPLASSISLSGAGLGTKYVYPVAHEYVEEGTIWNDTSVTPAKVYVWKEYRWYDTSDPVEGVAAEQDGIAPSPVTSLAGTSALPAGTTTPVIDLTWTPPTTRSNGASISGFLDGYDIWYKRTTEAVWKKQFVKDGAGAVSSAQINDAIILQNFNYNIRVYAVDIMGQYSTVATVNVLTAKYSETLNPPSKPTVSSRLGTITVSWDGNDSTGNLPVRGVLYVEVHRSTTSGFTPSSSTLISTIQNNLGGDYVVVSDLAYGTNYYFKLVFVRQISPTELEDSSPSTQSDAIQVSPLVDTDVIANTISGAKITPGTLIASEKIVANSITGAEINALAITAGKIAANAITADKIDTGAITASLIQTKQIELKDTDSSAKKIVLSKTGIFAYNGTDLTPTFSFDGATGTLNASALVVENINASKITTGTLSADRITVTDTFRYASALGVNPAYEVKIGSSAITSHSGVSAGLGFFQSGTQYGYLATWGTGKFEMGADFGSAYLTIGINGAYSLQANFSNGYNWGGTTFALGAALAVQRPSTSAVFVGSSESGNDRMLNINTTGNNMLVGNGNIASTNQTLDVYGRIRATGTITASTSLSSSRFKTDIREYTSPLGLLDITPKIYKYDNSVVYETWDDKTKNKMPAYSEDTIGAIAEDFVSIGLDHLVSRDAEGRPEALDYSKISVLLIPYIKDLYNQIEELKKER